ncbi:MAG: autotransporter domain-containing protein [Pseudomonadota bacterium]
MPLQILLLNNSGDITIETTGNITGTDEGISVTTPVGKGFVSIAGTVTGNGGTAINMTATPGIAELALRAGWGLSGQARTATNDTDDILSLGGTEDSSLDLSQIGNAANPNAIIGFDNLVKEDSSTWTLTGTQTAGAFQSTTVNGGTLINNGFLLSPVTVNSAVYGGTGTSNTLTVNAGGTIKPAIDAIGTLNVNGNLTFNSGSTYEVNLDATGATDLIATTGQATISSGATINVVSDPTASFPDVSPIYTIITAPGGVNGLFGGITDNLPDLAFIQTNTGTTLDLSYVRADPDSPTLSANLAGVPAFTPKEIHPSSLAAAMHSNWLFVDSLSRRVGLTLPDRDIAEPDVQALGLVEHEGAGTASPRGKGVWGAFMGERTRVDDDGAVPGWDADIGGLAFGIEQRIDALGGGLLGWPPVLVGLATGYTRTDVTSGVSDADIDSFHAGIYAAARLGALTLTGAGAGAYQSYDIDRVILLDGSGTTIAATGDPSGFTLTSSFEGVYDFNAAFGLFDEKPQSPTQVSFGPVLSVDVLYGRQDGFTETDAGILNLQVDDTHGTQVISGVGFAAELTRAIGDRKVSIEGRLAWEHVFGDRSITAQSAIAAVTAATFTTSSAEMDPNRITVGAGFAIEITDTLSAHARYDGRFSANTEDHRGSAGVTFRF